MKVVIDGTIYDGTSQPFVGDLRLLKKEFGFGWGTVIDRMQKLDTDAGVASFLDDDEFIDALVAWMWMVRRRAGEANLTREDAEHVALDQIEWIGESGDGVGEDADPTPASDRTGSDPADAAAVTAT